MEIKNTQFAEEDPVRSESEPDLRTFLRGFLKPDDELVDNVTKDLMADDSAALTEHLERFRGQLDLRHRQFEAVSDKVTNVFRGQLEQIEKFSEPNADAVGATLEAMSEPLSGYLAKQSMMETYLLVVRYATAVAGNTINEYLDSMDAQEAVARPEAPVSVEDFVAGRTGADHSDEVVATAQVRGVSAGYDLDR